jgi:hypothetical protein
MTDPPFRGAFPHQHHDPRGLAARIDAQIRERLEEAVEMAALKLMVDLRARHGLPAPETSSPSDRKEFEVLTGELLAHLRNAFVAELGDDDRRALEHAAAEQSSERDRILAGQVLLARRLPDYWQRFEAHHANHAQSRLQMPPAKGGWLGRLFRT